MIRNQNMRAILLSLALLSASNGAMAHGSEIMSLYSGYFIALVVILMVMAYYLIKWQILFFTVTLPAYCAGVIIAFYFIGILQYIPWFLRRMNYTHLVVLGAIIPVAVVVTVLKIVNNMRNRWHKRQSVKKPEEEMPAT